MFGKAISGLKLTYHETLEDWDGQPPICTSGKCQSRAQKTVKKSDKEIENEAPAISLDDMESESKDQTSEKISSLPMLVGVDRRSKWMFAHMVRKKGHHAQAFKRVWREI